MNNFFLRSFLILSWLVGISFSANAQDKTISYAAIDTHTKNYTDPDPPIVPGCDTTYLYSYLTNVTSASLTIQWTHVAPSIYGIPAPLSYELQLTDAQNNAIGLPITKAAPVLYSGQVGVNISETFNGLQPNTLYKIKIRQLCNLSPAPNQWSEYVTRSMTTLDVNNCNIFTGITASTTLSQYSIMIDVKTKPINSGIPYTIKIENLRGQKVYEAIFITGTPPFPSYFEVNSLDACTTYIVSASVNNCPIGMTTQVTTRCCGDIITAKIEELLPASLTVSWQNNSSQNFIPESYNLILQEKNPDGTYGDISTKSVDFSIGVIANGSVKFLETLNDLDPNKEYRVEIVPVCDACPNNSFQSANVKSKSTTEPCEEFGTPQYAEKQDCAAGGNLVFSSIQSTALTVNFNQIPASKQRKYFVKIIEKSTNTLIQGEWIIPNTNNAEVLSHTFVNLKENTDYRAELISYCCSTLDAENHCVWAIIPSDVKKEAKTGKDLCKAPTEYSIKTKTASTLTVQWKNNEAKLKRFVVQITDGAYFNASKEIVASGQLNQTLETVFDNLESGQKYVIKINAQCCKSLSEGVCNVWEDGSLVTFDAETETIKPIECTKTPTVFTFTPNGNSVDITWTPAGVALAHDARRFIVYYENKTIVIDDASKTNIKDLEKGKNYTFKIREVFDGFGPQFTSACDMQTKDISFADPCEPDFQASVKCAGIGSILINLNKKLPQKSKLVINYRDVTLEIESKLNKKASDYCGATTLCDIGISTSITQALVNTPFVSTEVTLDNKNNFVLGNLKTCAFYEYEADIVTKLDNGEEIICQHLVFPNYYHTLASITPTASGIVAPTIVDVNQNGIDDGCEVFENKSDDPITTTLQNIICGGDLPFSSTDQGTAYTKGKVKDVFYIDGFPMEITEITASSGNSYTGKGVIAVPVSDDKLRVEFSGITVNYLTGNILKVMSGSAKGISKTQDQSGSPANIGQIISAIDNANNKADAGFCNEPATDKAGPKLDAAGFDSNGNYGVTPPYSPYAPGDPYDPKYNPQGFDKDGLSPNGSKYNDCGCDKDGNSNPNDTNTPKKGCNPKDCTPYYWKKGINTTYGLELYNKENSNLKAEILKILNAQLAIRTAEKDAKKVLSDNIRADMELKRVALGHDKDLVFGKENKWINLGMNKFFSKPPIPFAVNMDRDENQKILEAQHKNLYYSDVDEFRAQLYLTVINELLSASILDKYVLSVGERIKQIENDKAQKMINDLTRKEFLDWLTEQITKKIDYDYGIKASYASVENNNNLEENETYLALEQVKKMMSTDHVKMDNIILAANNNDVLNDITKLQTNEPSKFAEWQEKNYWFDFEQGFDKVGGISRAFILRDINQKRMVQKLLNEEEVIGATDAVYQPLIKNGKTQAATNSTGTTAPPSTPATNDPGKVIYYDNFVFDATKGSIVDIFCIVNTGKKEFVVQALKAPLSFKGFAKPVKLGLATDFSFPISNVARFTLKGSKAIAPTLDPDSKLCADAVNAQEAGTFVEVSCKGFERINVDVKIEFCDKYFLPLDDELKNVVPNKLVTARFIVSATSFHDIVVPCLDITPFTLRKHQDFKFKLKGAVLDFSDERTPSTVKYPENYTTAFAEETTVSGKKVFKPTNAWKGFYIEKIEVTLPQKWSGKNGSPRTVYAEDFVIDEGGLSGKVGTTNVFDMNSGAKMGGWRFSMDDLNLTIVRNLPVGAGFNGKIHLPILKKEENWLYTAAILPNGDYQFAVTPQTKSTVDLWAAEIVFEKTSYVQIEKVNDDFKATAVLNGKATFNGTGKDIVSINDISFSKLTISSEEKNPVVNPGTWSAPSVTAKYRGFEFYLGNIKLRKEKDNANPNVTKTLLDFDIKLSLAEDKGETANKNPTPGQSSTAPKGPDEKKDKFHIAAGGSFSILGEVTRNDLEEQEWEYKSLGVNGLFVDCETSVFTLKGNIRFFKESKDYGEGFFGSAKFLLKKPKIGAEAMAIFGKKPGGNDPDGTFRYFIIDAMVYVPIPVAPINFTGIGGGISWHMSRVEPNKVTFENAKLDLDVPKTVSGVTYQPDPNMGLGIRLMTTLESLSNPKTFNGAAQLEVMFNAEGGLSYIALVGVAHFMAEPEAGAAFSLDPNKIKEGVHARLDMKLDLSKEDDPTFSANLDTYIYVEGGSVVGCADAPNAKNLSDCHTKRLGSMELFFQKDNWFINIGRIGPKYDGRVSLGIGLANGPMILASAYINIGKKIPPMVPLPAWAAKLVGNGLNIKDESSRATGRGFAFGASLRTSFSGEQKLWGKVAVYGAVNLDAGFDIMMQDYGKIICSNTGKNIGINGWYASGQLYAAITGEIGVKYKDKKFPLIEAGVAAVLQAKGPNPFWAKGAVAVHYSILWGTVKGDANFVTEIGKRCELDAAATNSNALDAKIISDITPEEGAEDVILTTVPMINFNFPIGEQFEFEALNSVTYKVTAKLVDPIVIYKNGSIVSSSQYKTKFVNGNTALKIVFNQVLQGKATYTITAKAFAYKNNNEADIIGALETKSVTFRTQDNLAEIPKGNIGTSYPMDGMYNYYIQEDKTSKGFILLKQGQPQLFQLPDGYSQAKMIIYKRHVATNEPENGDGDGNDGINDIVAEKSFTADYAGKKIEFDMPNNKLVANTYYKMQLVQKHNFDQLKDRILLTYYFRTSTYPTFYDKMKSATISTVNLGNNAYNFKITGATEPFDDREMTSTDGRLPMIVVANHLAGTSWYENFAKAEILNKYPRFFSVPILIAAAVPNGTFEKNITIIESNTDAAGSTDVGNAMIRFTNLTPTEIKSVDEEAYKEGVLNGIVQGEQGVKFTLYQNLISAAKQINEQLPDVIKAYENKCSNCSTVSGTGNSNGCLYPGQSSESTKLSCMSNAPKLITIQNLPTTTPLTFYYIIPKDMYIDPDTNSQDILKKINSSSDWNNQFKEYCKPTSIFDKTVPTN